MQRRRKMDADLAMLVPILPSSSPLGPVACFEVQQQCRDAADHHISLAIALPFASSLSSRGYRFGQ